MHEDKVEVRILKGNKIVPHAYFPPNKKDMKNQLLKYIEICKIKIFLKLTPSGSNLFEGNCQYIDESGNLKN